MCLSHWVARVTEDMQACQKNARCMLPTCHMFASLGCGSSPAQPAGSGGLTLHLCKPWAMPECAQLGEFGGDNRAGIDRTLHRISCLRNRDGRVIGLTCRAGRAVCGSAALAADLVAQGRSLLLLVRG